MYLLQVIAADWAGVDILVFYSCDNLAMKEAMEHRDVIRAGGMSYEQFMGD